MLNIENLLRIKSLIQKERPWWLIFGPGIAFLAVALILFLFPDFFINLAIFVSLIIGGSLTGVGWLVRKKQLNLSSAPPPQAVSTTPETPSTIKYIQPQKEEVR